jgi:hypothetical protein
MPNLRIGRAVSGLLAFVLAAPVLLMPARALPPPSPPTGEQSASPEFATIISRIVAGEKQYAEKLRGYTPRVETYLQYYEHDSELGDVPRKDAYFLGRLAVVPPNTKEISFIPDSIFDWLRRRAEMLQQHLQVSEFAVEPLVVDRDNFDQDHYIFQPVRWEQLGSLRCLAIDVHPRSQSQGRPFEGRIWVKEPDYVIVRLNGIRRNPPRGDLYVHFDCWRENIQPGVWLPVYIFSQESDNGLRFKAETRLWGYQVPPWRKPQMADAAAAQGRPKLHRKPTDDEVQRQLELSAEHNVIKRLERAGLLAPPGPIDQVLATVANNLRISNHLDKLPALQCRVLLTSTLESFSTAFTIVVSRGLIDVLPDEPSLAMILAHELAHISSPHRLNSQYARADGMDIPDEKLLASMDLARDRHDEAAADALGMEYLKNSPYKDQMGQAGLFLEAAARAARNTPHLFGAHLGNGLTQGSYRRIRMSALTVGAPALKSHSLDQIAALPLGSRVQVNAWDGSVVLTDRKPVALIAPSEEMPFQVTPVIPYLKVYAQPLKAQGTAQP